MVYVDNRMLQKSTYFILRDFITSSRTTMAAISTQIMTDKITETAAKVPVVFISVMYIIMHVTLH